MIAPTRNLVFSYKNSFLRNSGNTYITDNHFWRIAYAMNVSLELWRLGIKNRTCFLRVFFHPSQKIISIGTQCILFYQDAVFNTEFFRSRGIKATGIALMMSWLNFAEDPIIICVDISEFQYAKNRRVKRSINDSNVIIRRNSRWKICNTWILMLRFSLGILEKLRVSE